MNLVILSTVVGKLNEIVGKLTVVGKLNEIIKNMFFIWANVVDTKSHPLGAKQTNKFVFLS